MQPVVKRKLSMEMGTNHEEHDVEGSKQVLFRPYLRFTDGAVDNPSAFVCTFDADSLFITDEDAYNYLKAILGTMTKPASTYLDNFQLEKANGKAQDFRS